MGQNILALPAYPRESGYHVIDLTYFIFLKNILIIISREQIAASQHIKEDYAHTEDVAFLGITEAAENLGGRVPWGPAFLIQFFIVRGDKRSEAKISDFNIILCLFNFVDENVIQLDIPVHDALLMDEVKCEEKLH